MEIKKTLLMPKTDFEMRGNLINKEPIYLAKWKEIDLFKKMNEGKNPDHSFVLHDGPPYANGAIHCGHMLNRNVKDFIVRFKNMQGFYTPFTPGWDTHGLPIEVKVTKSGINRKTTPIGEFREKCREYAISQVNIQREQMLRLGAVGDFDKPYLTLLKEYEALQIGVFAKMALKGLIYKGLKPVYWSPSSESALAEAEIEYYDVKSYSIYVTFEVMDGKGILDKGDKVVIWTTTPWTLPANLAISAHPRFKYGLFDTDKGRLVFLLEFEDKLKEELALNKCELIKSIDGKDLELIKTKHPFYDRESTIILGEHVTNDAGTGLVHTAPGHGADDYIVSLKYNIKPYCPVDSRGYLDKTVGPRLEGMYYEDANKEVLEILKEHNALLKVSEFTHSYPHDWRTKKPLIFRATPQWFCSISPIRDELIKEIHNVKWEPAWGEQRMVNMIKDRLDWCISRQRVWGVPLPIIYNEDGSPIIDEHVFAHIEKLFREKGSDVWYSYSEQELLPPGYKNALSPNNKFRKETDIMDVWFDSGSSFEYNLINKGIKYPCDLYFEGSDQYRGWFNASLIISVAINGVAPYKEVISHGWVMDENWEKMSKSKGNGIDPSKIANQFGADILRLWAATVDYEQDMRISESIIKQVADIYKKLRNTFRFLLGNLANGEDAPYDPNIDKPQYFELVDTFMLAKFEKVKNEFIDAMEKANFSQAMSLMLTFLSTDMSSFYLDITKDILYCEAKDSNRRLAVQSVIYEVASQAMKLLTPILPFTMEEVNMNLPHHTKENPNLYTYPTKSDLYSPSVVSDYETFMSLRDDVLKSLEEARSETLIGSPQEAKVYLLLKDEKLSKMLSSINKDELARLFVVSEVLLIDSEDKVDGLKEFRNVFVKVIHHSGCKCVRCWNYKDEVIETSEGAVCKRCHEVLK